MNKLIPSGSAINYRGVCGLVETTNPSSYIVLPRNSQPIASGLGTETPDTEKLNPEVQVAEKVASFSQIGRGCQRKRRKASGKQRG